MIFQNNNHKLVNNMDLLEKSLRAKRKVQKVIKSCKTQKQLDGASKMIKNYNNMFPDHFGVGELEIQLLSKIKRL